jgi:glutamine synthetase
MSLFKNGENAFYDPNGVNGLSQDAYYFIGGLLRHARGMAALTNPIVNSYKRLIPGYEAPVYITWSSANRSPLIRIPVARDISTRVEMRNPDPSCNPYLALAVMLKSGLAGIRERITPPPAVDRNIYTMTDENLEENGIKKLPSDLNEAIDELMKDELIKTALGKHVLDNYVKAKRIEWEEYTSAVHPWELEQYLKVY